MIIGVAIRSDSLIVMLPKPNRHHNCFRYLHDIGVNAAQQKIGVKAVDQGFYTHTGKYLTREQALKYVKRIKQPLIDNPKKYLFSEDLW
jgi:hypothetical protein